MENLIYYMKGAINVTKMTHSQEDDYVSTMFVFIIKKCFTLFLNKIDININFICQ